MSRINGPRAVRLSQRVIRPSKASPNAGSNLYIAHGLLGNSNNWTTAATRLVNHPRLSSMVRAAYALDMRNHGESPHTPTHTNAGLATDLEAVVLRGQQELLREMHLSPVDAVSTNSALIGHSMGGFAVMGALLRRSNEETLLMPEEILALRKDADTNMFHGFEHDRRVACSASMRGLNTDLGFAETQPIRDVLFKDPSAPPMHTSFTGRTPAFGRVRAAVIVDVTPTMRLGEQCRPGGDTVKRVLDCMTNVQLDRVQSYDAAREELIRVGIKEQSMRDFVTTNFLLHEGKPATWKCNLSVLHGQYGSFQPSIMPWFSTPHAEHRPQPCTLPVLFVFGGKSPYNEAVHRDQIATFFPNATQIVIDGAGHFVHYEKPKEFAEVTASFLEQYL